MKTDPGHSKTALRRQAWRAVPIDAGQLQASGVEEALLFGEGPAGAACGNPDRSESSAATEVPATKPA